MSRTQDRCVDVLVDGVKRLGALSYLVPTGVTCTPGDAVTVPFGTRTAHGLVLGAGDTAKATREILTVLGRRADPADVATAAELARRHLCDTASVAARFAPRSAKGADPVDAGPVQLTAAASSEPTSACSAARRYLWCSPGVDRIGVAAAAAEELAAAHPGGGQVLVLCPTVALVSAVLGRFSSGAARLDASASRGAWRGFVDGTVAIGVGTRAAALYSPDRLAGIIVVDPEHPGHIEATQPHTHARDVAVLRAARRGVPLRLVSSVCDPAGMPPGVKLQVVGGTWPHVDVVDRADAARGDRLLPTPVMLAIRQALRTGPVGVVAPGRCRRVCAKCRSERPCDHHPTACSCTPSECARCGDTATIPSGWDATRLAASLANLPHADRLKVVTPDALGSLRGVDLVVLVDADAPRRTANLLPELSQVRLYADASAALAPHGRLLLVTRAPDDPVITAWAGADRLKVARACYDAAKAEGLPPFGRLVLVRAARKTAPATAAWPGRVHGPRRVADGEWEVLVRCDDAELATLGGHLDRLRRSAKLRVTVS
jgi:primosomal protein N'